METIEQGNKNWWVGVVVVCNICGFRGKLQENDKLGNIYMGLLAIPIIKCPTCHSAITVLNPNTE